MVASRKETNASKRPPATTPQAREKQLAALAYDLVEERMRAGTATSQETTHFLRIGSPKHQAELIKLEQETLLLKTRIANSESQARSEELFAKALKAMSAYQGRDEEEYDT